MGPGSRQMLDFRPWLRLEGVEAQSNCENQNPKSSPEFEDIRICELKLIPEKKQDPIHSQERKERDECLPVDTAQRGKITLVGAQKQ